MLVFSSRHCRDCEIFFIYFAHTMVFAFVAVNPPSSAYFPRSAFRFCLIFCHVASRPLKNVDKCSCYVTFCPRLRTVVVVHVSELIYIVILATEARFAWRCCREAMWRCRLPQNTHDDHTVQTLGQKVTWHEALSTFLVRATQRGRI
jgi:hypothetical protein